MPHHGEGPYVTGDYTSAEITERMLRRKINRLEKEKAELEMYLNSLPAKHRIDRLEREKAELVEAVKATYRKHHLNDESIGWEELSTILLNTLCNVLGDVGYQEWMVTTKKQGGE